MLNTLHNGIKSSAHLTATQKTLLKYSLRDVGYFRFQSLSLILHTTIPLCEFFPPHQVIPQHQLGVLQLSSILTPSTWRQHQIPQVKSQSHAHTRTCTHTNTHTHTHTPDANRVKLSLALLTDWPQIRGSHDPLLGFD